MICICQLLCPNRHCIIGVAYDVDKTSPQDAERGLYAMFEEAVKFYHVNRWCELCKSGKFHCEHGFTRFHTLDEAEPVLRQLEKEQILSQQFLISQRENKN